MEPKKVQCPECDADVQLDADGEGICGKCGLDVGVVIAKHRINKAVKKLDEKETPVPKKKTSPFSRS